MQVPVPPHHCPQAAGRVGECVRGVEVGVRSGCGSEQGQPCLPVSSLLEMVLAHRPCLATAVGSGGGLPACHTPDSWGSRAVPANRLSLALVFALRVSSAGLWARVPHTPFTAVGWGTVVVGPSACQLTFAVPH